MTKNMRYLAGAGAGLIAALTISSCAYDPYYGGSTSVGASYGEGRGYGSSGFSTSVFVSTGDPRWGYDPHRYSYYDYSRRSYYDPYLNGYYPVGYLPPIVYGVPHPYGWSPGRGYCPPPRRINNVTVVNYRDRAGAYRNSSYGWARQVRQQDRVEERRPSRNELYRQGTESRRIDDRGRTESYRQGSDSRQLDGRGRTESYRRDQKRYSESESRQSESRNFNQPGQGRREGYREDFRQGVRGEVRGDLAERRVAPGRAMGQPNPGQLRQAQVHERNAQRQADRHMERRNGPQGTPPAEGRKNNGKPRSKEEERRIQGFH